MLLWQLILNGFLSLSLVITIRHIHTLRRHRYVLYREASKMMSEHYLFYQFPADFWDAVGAVEGGLLEKVFARSQKRRKEKHREGAGKHAR